MPAAPACAGHNPPTGPPDQAAGGMYAWFAFGSLKVDTVARILGGLSRETSGFGPQHAAAKCVLVSLVLAKDELRRRVWRLRCDLFMIGQLRFAPDAAIGAADPSFPAGSARTAVPTQSSNALLALAGRLGVDGGNKRSVSRQSS